jgi:hypothetical protein
MNYRSMQLALVAAAWSLLAAVAVYLEWTGPAFPCSW